MEGPDRTLRLTVAAHIKAIADAEGRFDAWRAEAIANLLAPMRLQKSSFSFRASTTSEGAEGVAAGVGNVKLPEDTATVHWSVGEKEFRCGAYVVTKNDDRDFAIRHVTEIDADSEEGGVMRLRHASGQWEALLNEPRKFALGPLELVVGGRFVPWKVGV